MNTSELTEAIIMAASERGHLLVRNNSGVAKFKRGGKPYVVAYGVGPVGGGGGDLIGLTKDGIFLSVEIKVGRDKLTDKQKMWINWITMRGDKEQAANETPKAAADRLEALAAENGKQIDWSKMKDQPEPTGWSKLK